MFSWWRARWRGQSDSGHGCAACCHERTPEYRRCHHRRRGIRSDAVVHGPAPPDWERCSGRTTTWYTPIRIPRARTHSTPSRCGSSAMSCMAWTSRVAYRMRPISWNLSSLRSRISSSSASAGCDRRKSATRSALPCLGPFRCPAVQIIKQGAPPIIAADQPIFPTLDGGQAAFGNAFDGGQTGALGLQVVLVAPQRLTYDLAGVLVLSNFDLPIDELAQAFRQAEVSSAHV